MANPQTKQWTQAKSMRPDTVPDITSIQLLAGSPGSFLHPLSPK